MQEEKGVYIDKLMIGSKDIPRSYKYVTFSTIQATLRPCASVIRSMISSSTMKTLG